MELIVTSPTTLALQTEHTQIEIDVTVVIDLIKRESSIHDSGKVGKYEERRLVWLYATPHRYNEYQPQNDCIYCECTFEPSTNITNFYLDEDRRFVGSFHKDCFGDLINDFHDLLMSEHTELFTAHQV